MTWLNPAVGALAVFCGLGVVAATLVHRLREPAVDVVEILEDYDELPVMNEFQKALAEPFRQRMARALRAAATGRLTRFMPSGYLERISEKLVLSGASGRTASEFVVGQAALAGVLALVAVALVALVRLPPKLTVLVLVTLPVVGLALPTAKLNRQVKERKEAILRDLPDTLDLLAISVEAGMGFEGALDVVCRYFQSPLAEEFALTLREMGLGLARKDAFQNLKRRTAVDELSSFIQALLQADALGMPMGRVLKTQAVEMRNQRRMWAREKAGKLPVKILFPLMLFIFPPIMAVMIGPAAGSIGHGLK